MRTRSLSMSGSGVDSWKMRRLFGPERCGPSPDTPKLRVGVVHQKEPTRGEND